MRLFCNGEIKQENHLQNKNYFSMMIPQSFRMLFIRNFTDYFELIDHFCQGNT